MAQVPMLVWFFGIVLPISSIFGTLYLKDESFFVGESYQELIPTIDFISFTVSMSAVAESIGGILAVDSNSLKAADRGKLLLPVLVMILLSLVLFFKFAKNVLMSSNPSWSVTGVDVVW